MSYTHNTAPTQFVDVDNARYAYRRFGSATGTPIIMLNHFRAGMDNWDPAVTDGLAKNRPVILFNNAGIASSSGDPADSVTAMANHVIAFVRALGLEKLDVLGFSLGGFVAQEMTANNPDLVRRLILAGTGPQGGEDMNRYTPEVERHATQAVPTEDNFLYLFFELSETSQAAGALSGSVVTDGSIRTRPLRWAR
jgi:pimeloyl-ACP methyl ester carboxylesterase